ncbi:hypothetical protein HELRODRAFT_160535 [Helobdella robusta]|uniref:C-type lectin domain-containing protein n=1 Tax=Helobdella robusta TaxID=6412 RepID=T1EQD6_HELRO|nr:hypothetical protein HELRODRAFT_160535 [Helobdella robusta]ESO06368.1 hypothetical protein HELRODRAFT_160535 [Helobdella robusta]
MFWGLTILLMTSGMVFNIYELTQRYMDRPKQVTLSITRNDALNFPSVTICNMNPVKKSALEGQQNKCCPPKWLYYSNYCYGAFQPSVTWQDANSTCVRMKSILFDSIWLGNDSPFRVYMADSMNEKTRCFRLEIVFMAYFDRPCDVNFDFVCKRKG